MDLCSYFNYIIYVTGNVNIFIMSTLASQHWIMLKVKTEFNFFIPSGTECNNFIFYGLHIPIDRSICDLICSRQVRYCYFKLPMLFPITNNTFFTEINRK